MVAKRDEVSVDSKEDPKVQVTTYLLLSQKKQIAKLSKETRIPVSALHREAVDLLLKAYAKKGE